MSLLDMFPRKKHGAHEHGHHHKHEAQREAETITGTLLEIEQAFDDRDYIELPLILLKDLSHPLHAQHGPSAEQLQADVENMIVRKTRQILEEGRYSDFVECIDNLSSPDIREFTAADIADIASEIRESPDLTEAIERKLVARAHKGIPAQFTATAARFEQLGLISAEHARGIPGVQEEIRKHLVDSAAFPEAYATLRDLWVATGAITARDANVIPEIIRLAHEDLAEQDPPKIHEAKERLWESTGVITPERPRPDA